jgi:hypothetical protein
MKIFISVSIWLLFVFLKKIELNGWLDSIVFRLLWLRQLPEVDITFIWTIIKKLLIFPEIIFNQLKSQIDLWNFKYIQEIIIFTFYFLFSYATMIISSRFYWKDATIVKIILAWILLTIVYFI